MPDYQKTKIYCIRSPNTEMVYIGSTVQRLCERMTKHRARYKRWKDGKKHYSYCIKILEFGDAYIELIENFPCNNIEEQRAREGYYIRKNIKNGFCCGQRIAGRDTKKWSEENKEILKEKKKIYCEKNKEKIKLKQGKKYDCECGGKYTHQHKLRHFKSKIHKKFESQNETQKH